MKLLALALAGGLTLSACSQSTETQTGEAVEAVGNDIENAADRAGTAIDQGTAGIQADAKNAGNAIEGATDRVGNRVENAADRVGNTVENAADTAAATAGRATENVGEAVDKAGENMQR